jgi:toxin ParE1/3/4
MGKYSVQYISSAVDDLEDIFTYIAEDNTGAADSFLNEIDEAILHLEDFPNRVLHLRTAG